MSTQANKDISQKEYSLDSIYSFFCDITEVGYGRIVVLDKQSHEISCIDISEDNSTITFYDLNNDIVFQVSENDNYKIQVESDCGNLDAPFYDTLDQYFIVLDGVTITVVHYF